MIESNVSIKLESFEVPSLAREFNRFNPQQAPAVQQHPQQAPTPNEWIAPNLTNRQFQLSEIPAHMLLRMCEEYKKEVFKRAGKSDYLLSKAIQHDFESFKIDITKGIALKPSDIKMEKGRGNVLDIIVNDTCIDYEDVHSACRRVIPVTFDWVLTIAGQKV